MATLPATVIAPKVMKVTDIVDQWGLNLLLFGPPGAGKTTLAATAQDSPFGKDVLYVDIEGGVRSVVDRGDISVVRPTQWTELADIYLWLDSTPDLPYRTIVIDTITEAQRLGLEFILESSKTPDMPSLQDYGRSNEQMIRLVRTFRNLSYTKGWNVVFIAHEVEAKDEASGTFRVRPALTPKASEGIVAAVDAVGYLYIDKGDRVLEFFENSMVTGKLRQPRSGPQIPKQMRNPSLASLLEAYNTRHTGQKA